MCYGICFYENYFGECTCGKDKPADAACREGDEPVYTEEECDNDEE